MDLGEAKQAQLLRAKGKKRIEIQEVRGVKCKKDGAHPKSIARFEERTAKRER